MTSTVHATAAPVAAVVAKSASPRLPYFIPIAKLVATVLETLVIIWHQEHTMNGLRTDLIAALNGTDITPLTDPNGGETGLRTEIKGLRAEVAENGQRLARIEGFRGIGVPDEAPVSPE